DADQQGRRHVRDEDGHREAAGQIGYPQHQQLTHSGADTAACQHESSVLEHRSSSSLSEEPACYGAKRGGNESCSHRANPVEEYQPASPLAVQIRRVELITAEGGVATEHTGQY